MFNIFIKFTYPYVTFLIGAAYNIQQTIEGIGFSSSNFLVKDDAGRVVSSYLSPAEAIALPFFALLIYFVFLSFSFCTAGYSLARRRGLFAGLLILCIPGFLSILGFWPQINFSPEVYRIEGLGTLGSPYGMAALAILGLITGWACIIVITDMFSLQERFRHLYDHVWYSMAILAGLFFVTDSGTSEDQRALQDTTKHVQQASAYLLGQGKIYANYCKSLNTEQKISCLWANDIQQNLIDYTVYDDRLYWQLGPKTSQEMYFPIRNGNDDLKADIRRELRQYNEARCPTLPHQYSASSNICQRPPAEFCTGYEIQDSATDNMIRTVAISNECVIPTLVRLRTLMQEQHARIESASQKKHARWLFYILFAVLAGGKVANATAKFSKAKSGQVGLGDEENILKLMVSLGKGLRTIGRFSCSFILILWRCFTYSTKVLWRFLTLLAKHTHELGELARYVITAIRNLIGKNGPHEGL